MGERRIDQMIQQIQRHLRQQKVTLQSLLSTIDACNDCLDSVRQQIDATTQPSAVSGEEINTTATGTPNTFDSLPGFPDQEFEDFDVVLDLPQVRLLARENPATHTPLRDCYPPKLRPLRLRILRYLLLHPGERIGIGNITRIDKELCDMTHEGLAATIYRFRCLLFLKGPDGPYIITDYGIDSAISETGFGYYANPQWKYHVIESAIE